MGTSSPPAGSRLRLRANCPKSRLKSPIFVYKSPIFVYKSSKFVLNFGQKSYLLALHEGHHLPCVPNTRS